MSRVISLLRRHLEMSLATALRHRCPVLTVITHHATCVVLVISPLTILSFEKLFELSRGRAA